MTCEYVLHALVAYDFKVSILTGFSDVLHQDKPHSRSADRRGGGGRYPDRDQRGPRCCKTSTSPSRFNSVVSKFLVRTFRVILVNHSLSLPRRGGPPDRRDFRGPGGPGGRGGRSRSRDLRGGRRGPPLVLRGRENREKLSFTPQWKLSYWNFSLVCWIA